MNIAYGRLFSTAEQKNRSRVCIIGSKAAEELFKAAPALGKVITIDKEPFTVIGVLKKMENFSAFYDRNLSIFIPLPIGRRLFHTTLPSTAIHTIHAVGYDTTNMHRLERSLRRALRVRHRLSKTDPDDFRSGIKQGWLLLQNNHHKHSTSFTYRCITIIACWWDWCEQYYARFSH